MPNIDFLRRIRKRSIPTNILQSGPVLNLREGESKILTYTSAAKKLKIFSAFIREGLETGGAVYYIYPDDESETVTAKLKEHGINVEEYKKDDTLHMESLSECFMPNGILDTEKAVVKSLNWWAEAKKKGYKHVRDIEDVGRFSFVNGQWQKYVADYWLDPRWNDPNVSQWSTSKEAVGVVYDPFLREITAINVEHMTRLQVTELLKAFGRGTIVPARFIDLIGDMDLFSRSIGLDHERLVGRKILLEIDPISNYEKAVGSLAKETIANVESFFVFTSTTSPIHTYLEDQTATKFFLTSISTSYPEPISENKVLLPAKSTSLILDALSKVLETHADANVCVVLDILTELLATIGREKTFTFLRYALGMLSSEKTTSFFLLNTGAHEAEVVSQLRNLFSNQLAYDKNGLEIVKIS